MVDDFPTVGQVFQYHFLWKWQAKKGQLEGSKARPSCVAIIVANSEGNRVLFIAPITSKEPIEGREGVRVPETEARRARLDTVMPLWVMVDELNAEILETSFTLESREPQGAFSTAFTDAIVRGIHKSRQAGKTRLTQRK
ncbi:MAG: hypothetical protein AAFR68_03415 [Pseudomonadota bacterium]